MGAEEIVDGSGPGGAVDVEPLGGGITNHNFKVALRRRRVRAAHRRRATPSCSASTGARSTRPPARRRGRRRAGGRRVRRARGLPRDAVHRGRPRSRRAMREPDDAAAGRGRAAARPRRPAAPGALRRLPRRRGVPRDGGRARGLGARRVRAGARARATRSSARLGRRPERPCHNDLLTANFIDDGTRIRIVDWEYAGMGDRFFDLANFAVNNDLDARTTTELLARVLRRRATPSDVARSS